MSESTASLTTSDLRMDVHPTPSEALLERNLSIFRARDPELVERILAADEKRLEIEVAEDGHPTALWEGRRLASARRPGEETIRQVDGVDPVTTGLVAVVGFGLGQHVAVLARRLGRSGIVLVAEPDRALLRAVFSRIDATSWLSQSQVVITDRADAGELGPKLAGAEGTIMLGVRIIEHPASRVRLGSLATEIAQTLRELVDNARMNVVTTLLRCVGTLENQLGNLPRFSLGAGVEDLRGIARGRLGVVVSAGPSLRRNIEELARPGVRDRCVIIATQTTLKPLLAKGIAPHYVTALDYHEISRRFYEGIDPRAIEDTELVIDSKVNPVVPEAWPGRVRCIPSSEIDGILGSHARGGTAFPPCATVAHLCHALARHMGCDPVALIGQDLGFTDGLYYAPGNAIHDVWNPEFGDFNTIETMEWERIVRHRGMLSTREDVHGRRIFTDVQMLTYLRRFETVFLEDERQGLRVIDATEGGVRKSRTELATLAETIEAEANPDTSPIALPQATDPGIDAAIIRQHVVTIMREVDTIRQASVRAGGILRRMLDDQDDPRRMDRHFKALGEARQVVDAHDRARRITDLVNQIGVYKRRRADRLISLDRSSDPVARQRLELDRDVVNVDWMGEAASLLHGMLERTLTQIDTGVRPEPDRTEADLERAAGLTGDQGRERRVIAVVPVDPERGGIGVRRRLDEPVGGRPLLQRTLERLGRSTELAGIVVLVPGAFDLDSIIDRTRIDLPVECRRLAGGVFGEGHQAVRAARINASSAWRGGIQGLTVYDEVLAPGPTLEALEAMEADAAVLVGPDWALVAIDGDFGVDEVVRRHRDRPSTPLVFVQAPPGIGSCLVTPELLRSFAGTTSRRASIGHLLGYRSDRPEGDPVANHSCVVAPARIRDAVGRFIPDSPRRSARLEEMLRGCDDQATDPCDFVSGLEAGADRPRAEVPAVVRVELGTERIAESPSIPDGRSIVRESMDQRRFRMLVEELAEPGDVVMVFDGVGDPMLHPEFDVFARIAIDAGVRQVRIRTDLVASDEAIDRLVAAPIEVVEVDLDAETASTWTAVHGRDGFDQVRRNLERLVLERAVLGDLDDLPHELRTSLPWIAPRLQRRAETIEEMPEFFERWRQRLGTAVIDGPVRWPEDQAVAPDPLSPTHPPSGRDRIVAESRMTILSDGTVPVLETDLRGERSVGRVGERSLTELWRDLVEARRSYESQTGAPPTPWRAG
ncbi:MAG: hypothetical protein CMJ51_00200 [Planctomycetaceae bacterium]|nr:hypothetical protein [Planctomycetaceae bacterium]